MRVSVIYVQERILFGYYSKTTANHYKNKILAVVFISLQLLRFTNYYFFLKIASLSEK
jgi:hypothetical protein